MADTAELMLSGEKMGLLVSSVTEKLINFCKVKLVQVGNRCTPVSCTYSSKYNLMLKDAYS